MAPQMLMVLHCAGWPGWLNVRTLVGSILRRCQHPEVVDYEDSFLLEGGRKRPT